ncbi:hypothetical protein [Thaumasiovibrio subtropicus]|uniref:hypothetical protein n=1 Tax=Thaumasiovibrio subtropicus TaxID=1891207 RepID=UPI0039C933CF
MDTSKFTSGRTTMYGDIGNRRQFWRQWKDTFSGTLSSDNLYFVKSNRSPVVDEHWIDHFPEHADHLGDLIIHHHLDYGHSAIPLPKSLHSKRPGWRI